MLFRSGLTNEFEKAYNKAESQYKVPNQSIFQIGLGMVAPTILAHASDEAREKFLRAMWRADIVACQLFSEPGALVVTTSLRVTELDILIPPVEVTSLQDFVLVQLIVPDATTSLLAVIQVAIVPQASRIYSSVIRQGVRILPVTTTSLLGSVPVFQTQLLTSVFLSGIMPVGVILRQMAIYS